MAFTGQGVDTSGNGSNVQFDITVVINNITRVVSFTSDDLTGPPMARMEFDVALKVFIRAMWYGAAGTPAQKIAALKAGVNLATVPFKLRDYANNVDVTS